MSNPSDFIKTVPLFKRLPASELPKVASAMETKKIEAGTVVFKQGDKGDSFYIIYSGEAIVNQREDVSLKIGDSVEVGKEGGLHFGGNSIAKGTKAIVDKFDPSREYPYTIRICETGQRGRVLPEEVKSSAGEPQEKTIATLRAGDYFGEQSLLRGANRGATIIAKTELVCFNLTRDKFKTFSLGEKLQFVKREAVFAGHDEDEQSEKRDTTKTKEDKELISDSIHRNQNLQSVLNLAKDNVAHLVESAWKMDVPTGTELIKQGDLFADKFFIVAKGEFSISIKNEGAANETQAVAVGKCTKGASFGELALLYHAPRAATVTCTQGGMVWVISRTELRNVLMRANDKKLEQYAKALRSAQSFGALYSEEIMTLAENVVEISALKGEALLTQGESGNTLFILYEGTVEVVKDGKVVASLEGKPDEKAEVFGEKALINDELRLASVICKSENVTCLALERSTFERLLGPLKNILEDPNDESKRREHKSQFHGKSAERPKIDYSQLKRLGLLGCGGFGAVTLEQDKEGKTYALKALSKGYIVKMRMQKSVLREKEILLMCDSKFVVKLYMTYKTKETLYFLLEPCMGGELFATYHKHHFHGSVTKAKFYSSSVVFAFEHLHERHVLYRDLKPENLLLDSGGFCKLTDMGLAKVVTGKTYTTCGTPDYFAPEVIQQTGMTQAVDWWTLGVLIHELLCGQAPFEASDPMDTYRKIVRGVTKVQFMYADRDPYAVQLVQNLLKHVPNERLPMRAGGTKNLKQHPWYKGQDWDALYNLKVPPPYQPQVKSNTDMANFRAAESDLPPQIPYKDTGSNWDAEF